MFRFPKFIILLEITMTAQYIIAKLNLIPHPEGGYYRETYRSDESISMNALPERYLGDRSFGTAIYFLLESKDEHKLHKLKTDEIWHYYSGSALQMKIQIGDEMKELILGNDLSKGEVPQILIPRDTWMIAKPIAGDSYTLVGCTTAPGFDFEDFEVMD